MPLLGRTEDNTNLLDTLLPVTYFNGNSIFEADISDDKKYIAPNPIDIHDRHPLQTNPPWPDNYSYQVLVPTKATLIGCSTEMGDRLYCQSRNLPVSNFSWMNGVMSEIRRTAIQYARPTEEPTMPIHITAGVTEDADSSATLEDDVAVLNKINRGYYPRQRSGWNITWGSLGDNEEWVIVGPRGRPLTVMNTGRVGSDDSRECRRGCVIDGHSEITVAIAASRLLQPAVESATLGL